MCHPRHFLHGYDVVVVLSGGMLRLSAEWNAITAHMLLRLGKKPSYALTRPALLNAFAVGLSLEKIG